VNTDRLSFIHVYQPPAAAKGRETGAGLTLLLLHGTGGNEHDMLSLAPMLAPGAGVLSPRGKVLENGMPRFFRRLAEGVFDMADLERRTHDLAEFVIAAAPQYHFDPRKVVAVGFSNGANIASSLVLARPGVLAGAIVFRGMVSLMPEPMPPVPKTPVLVSNGRTDPLVPVQETERLVRLLELAGADVTLLMQPAGHELTRDDVEQASHWLSEKSATF